MYQENYDGRVKYGGFVYFSGEGEDDCIEDLSAFGNNKKEIISYLRGVLDVYKEEPPEEPIESVWVELWRKDENELWGNSGAPIYRRELVIKRKGE